MSDLVPFDILQRISEMGRTRVLIRCPFCGAEFWGYVWSLSANGKRCPGCGSIHYRYGAEKK